MTSACEFPFLAIQVIWGGCQSICLVNIHSGSWIWYFWLCMLYWLLSITDFLLYQTTTLREVAWCRTHWFPSYILKKSSDQWCTTWKKSRAPIAVCHRIFGQILCYVQLYSPLSPVFKSWMAIYTCKSPWLSNIQAWCCYIYPGLDEEWAYEPGPLSRFEWLELQYRSGKHLPLISNFRCIGAVQRSFISSAVPTVEYSSKLVSILELWNTYFLWSMWKPCRCCIQRHHNQISLKSVKSSKKT